VIADCINSVNGRVYSVIKTTLYIVPARLTVNFLLAIHISEQLQWEATIF